MTSTYLRTFGRFELVDTEGSQLLGRGKPLAVLLALEAQPRRTLSRDYLVDLLWGEQDADRGRQSLRQALVVIRRFLGLNGIVGDGDQLTLGAVVQSDRGTFISAVGRGDLKVACETYEGEFLPECAFPGGARFEQWVDAERRHLLRHFLQVSKARVRDLLADGAVEAATDLSLRVRDADVLSEEGWRLHFECLALAGDQLRLHLAIQTLRSLLEREERETEPATARWFQRALGAELRQVSVPREGELFVECVGREREFASLLSYWERTRLDDHPHSVRVMAPSGLGKSRLLAEFRRRLKSTGARVVMLSARLDERDLACAFVGDLVAAVGALPGAAGVSSSSASVLVGLAPALHQLLPVAPLMPPPDECIRIRALAFADLLSAVASERPFVVLCDDAQWADQASRSVIAGALARARGGILCVSADRSAGTVVASEAPSIVLPPLDERNVVAMLEAVGELDLTSASMRRLLTVLGQHAAGSPLLLVQALHALRTHGALVLCDGRWELVRPALAIEIVERQSGVLARVVGLASGLREHLVRLALICDPVPSELLPESWCRTLVELERLGFTQRRDEGWQVSHESIAEAVCESFSRVEQQRHATAAAELVESFPHEERWLVRSGRLRWIAGETALAISSMREFAIARRSRGDERSGVELAISYLGTEVDPVAVRRLSRAAPLGSRARRARRLVALSALSAIVIAAWVGSRDDERLVLLRQPVLQGDGFAVVSPVLELVSSDGQRRVDRNGDTVRVALIADSAFLIDGGAAQLERGRAVFASMRFAGRGAGVLQFTYPGARATTSDTVSLGGQPLPSLRILGGRLNGMQFDDSARTLRLRPGDAWIEGTIRIGYRALDASAAVVLVAAPSWIRGSEGCFVMTALANRVSDATRSVSLRLPAPKRRGSYRVILAHATETQASFVCSQTNWKVGAPVWGDGMDLQDLDSAGLQKARVNGSALLPWRYEGGTVIPNAVGIASFEVVR